jgi:hypothetical protein
VARRNRDGLDAGWLDDENLILIDQVGYL